MLRPAALPRQLPLVLGRHARSSSSDTHPPTQARAVVVGGGIIGSSVAYHLARANGWKGSDVLLLEKHSVTSGTTWHAAGLCVTFGSLSETSTRMRQYTKTLYRDVLEAETGQATGFRGCGFIELATNADRLTEFRRVSAFNRHMGIDVQEISPREVQTLFPLCRVDDVLAGFYVPTDGRVNPVDATNALVKGARMKGVKIMENTPVASVKTENGRATGVVLESGHEIQSEFVVNCAGMWARQLASKSGVSVPNQAAEHYYLITAPMDDVDPLWPVVEDPSSYTYIRPEAGGLMVGLFEPEAAAWNVKSVPDEFAFGEIEPDLTRMTPFLEKACSRVPRTLEVGMKKFFCGPESFTPDLAPYVGEAPELRNYFVAAGLNSIGILTGGGVGRLLATWIAEGRPDMDVTAINVDRARDYETNREFRGARVVESLGLVYRPHYPFFTHETARNVKKSPLHERLEARRGFFRPVSGWECPAWYAPEGHTPSEYAGRLGWGRPDWFAQWEREHRACRERAVLIDMSFMSKFLVVGRDAGRVLNRLATANVDGASGRIHYTQFLSDEGKLEADVTVMKEHSERFVVIATDTAHRHVETWLRRHIPADAHAFVSDITGGHAQINVQGPESRALLQTLTEEDLSDAAFPFLTARTIPFGLARVVCARITYVGELGYELHVPAEHARHVYDRITSAYPDLQHAGLSALGSLRLEKAYRDFGHDMDNTDTLLECGLGFTCDFDKAGGFQGRDAVLAQKQAGLARLPQRLVQVCVQDPQPMMFHGEVVYCNGERVGDIRAASYGHTLGGSVGLAMVKRPPSADRLDAAFLRSAEWHVEIANERYPARLSLVPMYDPKNEKIKQ